MFLRFFYGYKVVFDQAQVVGTPPLNPVQHWIVLRACVFMHLMTIFNSIVWWERKRNTITVNDLINTHSDINASYLIKSPPPTEV